MLKNLPHDPKNAVFCVKMGNLPTPSTGATVALHWRYFDFADKRTPKRHRMYGNRNNLAKAWVPQKPPNEIAYSGC